MSEFYDTPVATAIFVCNGSQKIRVLLPMTHELSEHHGSEPVIGIAWNIIDRTENDKELGSYKVMTLYYLVPFTTWATHSP
jgi:hypothetical protein